jgi:hypothetical protein
VIQDGKISKLGTFQELAKQQGGLPCSGNALERINHVDAVLYPHPRATRHRVGVSAADNRPMEEATTSAGRAKKAWGKWWEGVVVVVALGVA